MHGAAELIAEGRRARARGDRNTARKQYAAAAELYLQNGSTMAYAHTVRHIAEMWFEDAEFTPAHALLTEALELYRGSFETRVLDLANAVRPYALLKEATGELEAARILWEEARALYGSLRVAEGVTECDAHLRALHARD